MLARSRIPNALTLSRLAMAAVFFWLLAMHRPAVDAIVRTDSVVERLGGAWRETPELLVATALFVVAALTDALDGFLARRWKVISRFGRVMDPLADKVLVLGAFVMLAGPGFVREDAEGAWLVTRFEPWMVVVVLTRELLVTSLRGVLEAEGLDFSAGLSGKLKMIAQSVAVPLILLIVALTPTDRGGAWDIALRGIAWATVLITAASGVPYVVRSVRLSAAGAGPQGRGGAR